MSQSYADCVVVEFDSTLTLDASSEQVNRRRLPHVVVPIEMRAKEK